MLLMVVQYLLAAPFVALWAVCLLGNAWMLLSMLGYRWRSAPPEPVPAIGGFCGVVAILLLPIAMPWWQRIVLAITPEVIGGVLALIVFLLPRSPSRA